MTFWLFHDTNLLEVGGNTSVFFHISVHLTLALVKTKLSLATKTVAGRLIVAHTLHNLHYELIPDHQLTIYSQQHTTIFRNTNGLNRRVKFESVLDFVNQSMANKSGLSRSHLNSVWKVCRPQFDIPRPLHRVSNRWFGYSRDKLNLSLGPHAMSA